MFHTVKIDVDQDAVRNLLVLAFEGGSNYWARLTELKLPPGTKEQDFNTKKWTPAYILPFVKNGGIKIEEYSDDEVDIHLLDTEKLKRGLDLMAKTCTHHFCDVLTENTDIETGDVFLQLCLLGELKYG